MVTLTISTACASGNPAQPRGTSGAGVMILRNNKLNELKKINPEIIISANIGCISHLQSGTDKPVMHWVEVLANELENSQRC